jgi:hypothetical protein
MPPATTGRSARSSCRSAIVKLDDRSLVYLDLLADQDRVERTFNTVFFTSGASREAELAGIWGAVVGSFFTMVVTLAWPSRSALPLRSIWKSSRRRTA